MSKTKAMWVARTRNIRALLQRPIQTARRPSSSSSSKARGVGTRAHSPDAQTRPRWFVRVVWRLVPSRGITPPPGSWTRSLSNLNSDSSERDCRTLPFAAGSVCSAPGAGESCTAKSAVWNRRAKERSRARFAKARKKGLSFHIPTRARALAQRRPIRSSLI